MAKLYHENRVDPDRRVFVGGSAINGYELPRDALGVHRNTSALERFLPRDLYIGKGGSLEVNDGEGMAATGYHFKVMNPRPDDLKRLYS